MQPRKIKLLQSAKGVSVIRILHLTRREGNYPSKRSIRRQLGRLKK